MNTHPKIALSKIPSSPDMEDFDRIFSKLHPLVSDIFIQPDCAIIVRFAGKLYRASDSEVTKSNADALLGKMINDNQKAQILKGSPQSWLHKARLSETKDEYDLLRFRCNSKSVQTLYEAEGLQLNLRPIESRPRRLKDLHLPAGLIEGLFPDDGIVLFSGPTGSGKTTSLAATMAELCYHPDGRVIITVEDPVEYNLHVMKEKTGFITHCEIGRNVTTFPLAMRAALRENPDVIMTGEMRDTESMQIAIEAAGTGHSVYSTIHCNSVSNVFVRVAQKLSEALSNEAVNAAMASFIQSSRVFVYQRLFPSIDDSLVPIIEFVCLTPDDRVEISQAYTKDGVMGATRTLDGIIEKSGLRYAESARRAFEDGRLNRQAFDKIVKDHEIDVTVERGY